MSKHRRKVPLMPCRCNCHNPEWRKMAAGWRRMPSSLEHKNCGECHAELQRERTAIYRDYLEFIGCA